MPAKLDGHRKATGGDPEIFSLNPPFSFFDFIESNFGGYDSIRRVFSLSRSFNAQSLIVESIPAVGIIAEENEDLLQLNGSYKNKQLLRLSFWKNRTSDLANTPLNNDDLVGYTILKNDRVEDPFFDKWHVFESVFAKYPHDHNCVPRPGCYELQVCGDILHIHGVLYCQQNTLNKACAQVALRSLLSRVLPESDISYRRINQIASSLSPNYFPGNGLNVAQIRLILESLGLKYADIDYTGEPPETRKDLPYQKYLYAGLEAGAGSLIGFRLSGIALEREAAHIIPIYGHTFNKDTWAPNADFSYFRIGEDVGFIPSENWTSSFLGHDDNFGPNFCIPRLYIENMLVDYVVEIFRPGVEYSGVQAEAMALNMLYSIIPHLVSTTNEWITRLIHWTQNHQIVFRAQALTSEEYIQHLTSINDWESNEENLEICELLAQEIPEMLWAVEISTPQLFPANERKLGEIVFDASQVIDTEDESTINNVFILSRLPGIYLFGGEVAEETLNFTPVDSSLQSHTDLIKM